MEISYSKTVNIRLIIKQKFYTKVSSFLQSDISKKWFNIKFGNWNEIFKFNR